MDAPITITRAGDSSLLVRFGDEISPAIHRRVRAFLESFQCPGVRNLHPAYASVLISFQPLEATHEQIETAARAAAAQTQPSEPRLVKIPTRYGGEFGPDLADVAAHCGLTQERVVKLHTGAEYLVYFLGFSPGFAYLGGLPDALFTPRLSTPRHHVPAGSVAIGGRQTGIYPLPSPGGWRLIGRTDLTLFDPTRQPPTLLEMGDRVRFVQVRP
ncbi:MAG: 5-oxoprolinase subunit PxpB [Acidobacteria bacterium]|nr:5-oxoprolinase subunit PxpB [Acidobacteriota bacterium]